MNLSLFLSLRSEREQSKDEKEREREKRRRKKRKSQSVTIRFATSNKNKRKFTLEVNTAHGKCLPDLGLARDTPSLLSSYLNHELERPHHEQTMHDNHVRGITFFDQSHGILRVDLKKEKKERKKLHD